MNVFIRELKAHRKSTLLWCIGAFYVIAASMWKFGTEYSSNQSLNELISQLPKVVQVLLGIRGSFDLSTPGGYYGLLYYYIIILATMHAVFLGADIISREERDKTIEFLIAKPVTRVSIVTAKLASGLINILILNLVTTGTSVILAGYFNKQEAITGEIIKLMIGMFLLQLIFLLAGSGMAAISKNPKTAAGTSVIVLLSALLIAKIIDMDNKLEYLKYFTPIKYFEAEQLLLKGGFRLDFLILSGFFITLLMGITYVCYQKRDMKI